MGQIHPILELPPSKGLEGLERESLHPERVKISFTNISIDFSL